MMPDADRNSPRAQADATPRPAPSPVASEKVILPPTEAERRAAHMTKVAEEGEEQRRARRDEELAKLYAVHMGNVQELHASHPTPAMPFEQMSLEDQLRWNEKRSGIDSANRAYSRAIKAAYALFREEDIHLVKLRDAAKPTA